MNATHKRRLAAGRRAAAEKRRKADDRALIAWRRWLVEEADAYREYRRLARIDGDGASDTDKARRRWQRTLKSEPRRPTDAAFKRARGEDDSDA